MAQITQNFHSPPARQLPLRFLLIFSLFYLLTGLPSRGSSASGQSFEELAPPPVLPAPVQPAGDGLLPAAGLSQAAAACAGPHCIYLPTILRQAAVLDRDTSLNLYQTLFLSAEGISSGWTGNVAACQPGTTSAAFKTAVLNRINYFRQAAGILPLTGLDATYNQKAQAAALMMSNEGSLSHTPGTDWGCYTASGAEAAGKSNLGLGMYGPGAIQSYMRDHGANNTAVGHRRWILYPQTRTMGTGDIPPSAGYPAAQALWVITPDYGSPRPATRSVFVSWPPAGYIPYPVVYARWSFSYPNADFSAATVSLSQGGSPVPVTKYPVVNGYGENTLAWIINGMSDTAYWPRPAQDTAYTVTIQGVIIDGQSQNFSYTVVIFDPG